MLTVWLEVLLTTYYYEVASAWKIWKEVPHVPIRRICSLPLPQPSISIKNWVFSLLLDSCSPSDFRCIDKKYLYEAQLKIQGKCNVQPISKRLSKIILLTWDNNESISSMKITAGCRQLATPKRALTSFSPSPICQWSLPSIIYKSMHVGQAYPKSHESIPHYSIWRSRQSMIIPLLSDVYSIQKYPFACQRAGRYGEECRLRFSSYCFSNHSLASTLILIKIELCKDRDDRKTLDMDTISWNEEV